MNARTFLVLAFVVMLIATVPTGATQDDDVLLVDQDATWTGSRDVVGGLRIVDGATLRLEGAHVRFGGPIEIEAGATLVALPAQGVPTTLEPIDAASEFWIDTAGRFEAAGTPPTVIRGLAGKGLESATYGGGGIWVQGNASLTDIEIRDGQAGLGVPRGGRLHLERATVVDNGQVGVAVLGTATFRDVEVTRHSIFDVIGKDTCAIDAEDLRIDDPHHVSALVVNSCTITLRGAEIDGAGVPITLTGSAVGTFADVLVTNYTIDGFSSSYIDGRALPRFTITNTSFVPGPTSRFGLEFLNVGHAVLDGVTVRGTQKSGLQLSNSRVEVRNSVFEANAQYGIIGAGGSLLVELETTSFGRPALGTQNKIAPLRHVAIVSAEARDETDHGVPGLEFLVFDVQGERLGLARSGEGSVARLQFESYQVKADGNVLYRGPFHYEATIDGYDESFQGPLTDTGAKVVLRPTTESTTASNSPWLVGVLGLVLIAAVIGFSFLRRRKQKSAGTDAPSGKDVVE